MMMVRPGRSRSQQILPLVLFACGLGLLIASLGPLAAQVRPPDSPRELTLEQYRSELERCAGAIQRPSEIRQLQDSLPAVWVVRIGEGRVEVSTQPIRSQLLQLQLHSNGSKSAEHELRSLVNALKQEAAEMDRSEWNVSTAWAKATLDEILKRKEFQGAQGPSALEIFMNKVARWLFEKLAGLFSRLHLGARTSNVLVWTVIGLAFLALCSMGWKWLKNWQPALAAPQASSSAPSDARQWVQEALAAAERGDYRAALHCAYWGAVARLEDLGRLSRDRARTPRESLCLLENHPSDHRALEGLTKIFERVWYGYRAASQTEWTGARELLERIGCLEASIAPTASS